MKLNSYILLLALFSASMLSAQDLGENFYIGSPKKQKRTPSSWQEQGAEKKQPHKVQVKKPSLNHPNDSEYNSQEHDVEGERGIASDRFSTPDGSVEYWEYIEE